MHVLHVDEDPDAWVNDGLFQANPGTRNRLLIDGVTGNSVMGKLALLRCQPAGGQRLVWQGEAGDCRNNESDLKDTNVRLGTISTRIFSRKNSQRPGE